MAKKNRTGLQSEVSHIFAGVPIPKKRRSRSGRHEQKPETKEETQQTPAEQPPSEQPAAEPIAEESLTQQSPMEQEQIEETPVEQSQVTQPQIDQSTTEETPIEHLMAPQPQIEESEVEQPTVPGTPLEEPIIVEIPAEEKQDIKLPVERPTFEQPTVMEPSVDQSPVPFSDTIEVPELEEPLEAVKQPASVMPPKTRVAKESAAAVPRKVSVRKKDKRFVSKSSASSRRQKTMVILVIALSILLFFLLVKPFKKLPQNITGRELAASANFGNNVKPDIDSMKIEWTVPDIYPTGLRDPMKESSAQQLYSKTGTPIVRGISYSVEQKYAIMNTGDIVQEGEDIFGWKVLKINPDSVIFEKDSKKLELEPQGEK